LLGARQAEKGRIKQDAAGDGPICREKKHDHQVWGVGRRNPKKKLCVSMKEGANVSGEDKPTKKE